jgi:hypothetical protein
METTENTSIDNPRCASDEIAQRAYQLWEKAGRPDGKDLEFWLEAEAQGKKMIEKKRDHSFPVPPAPLLTRDTQTPPTRLQSAPNQMERALQTKPGQKTPASHRILDRDGNSSRAGQKYA